MTAAAARRARQVGLGAMIDVRQQCSKSRDLINAAPRMLTSAPEAERLKWGRELTEAVGELIVLVERKLQPPRANIEPFPHQIGEEDDGE